MGEWLIVTVASQKFFYMMVSFAFFIGIMLMISPDAFDLLNRAFSKEYGLKKKLIPKLEESFDVVDRYIVRNRAIAGIMISVTSFILLIIFK